MQTIPPTASSRPFILMQANRIKSGDFVRRPGSGSLFSEAFDSIRRGLRGYYVPVIRAGVGLAEEPVRCPESLLEVAC